MRYHAGTLTILVCAAAAVGCGETNTAPEGSGTEVA